MKKWIAILAFAGLLIQTFSMVVIYAEYYANQDFIAKNLCENRDKPMMHCNGKCCLKKKLANSSKEQAPGQRSQKSEQVVNLFYTDTCFSLRPNYPIIVSSQYFSYNDLETFSFHHSVFHPPTA